MRPTPLRLSHEQPACLHAGMDLYAQVAAMESGAPGEVLVDAFRAAAEAREVDMRASPYDLSAWGLPPIPVETPARSGLPDHAGVAPNNRPATSVTTRPNPA